ncbi:hypothetical protein ABIB40_001134 [Pedobacter sp. UYP30]|uniref:DUF3127 domain-containing protein n=1 Tax=Pedobacter sp. UYP30 TaxID=1756400 RepID=UPI0033942014
MEIKGKVHEVGEIQQISETFKKRDLVVEYAENPQYPEYLKFEALQDKTGLLDSFKVGDEVEVFFNLRGRPWTDKAGKTAYFNSMVIWRVNALSTAAAAPNTPPMAQPVDVSTTSREEDDLPF